MPSTRRSISEDCIDLFFQLAPVPRTTCHPPKIVAVAGAHCAAAAKATCFLEFGLGFGVRILWNMIRPPSSPTTLSMHWCGTDWCTMIAFDFVCQNCNPRSCARDNFYPDHSVLVTSPMTFLRNFSGFRKIITWLLSFMCITSEWIK